MCERTTILSCESCEQWAIFSIAHHEHGCLITCTNCHDISIMSEEDVNIKVGILEINSYVQLFRGYNQELGKLNRFGDHINPPIFHRFGVVSIQK